MKRQHTKVPSAADKALADLGQLFPERALLLVNALRAKNKRDKKFPEWREEQITKFGSVLTETAMDLVRAYGEQRITTLAWATRNLLEIWVWIDYCNLSETHAKRFWDDTWRDLYGLCQAVQRSVEVETGRKHEPLEDALAHFGQWAQSIGIQALGDDFKRVSDAAEELGRQREFLSMNKQLSKWAHPTSWAVRSSSSKAAEEGFMTLILQDGVFLAMNSIITIRKVIRAQYPEIAKSDGDLP